VSKDKDVLSTSFTATTGTVTDVLLFLFLLCYQSILPWLFDASHIVMFSKTLWFSPVVERKITSIQVLLAWEA